MTLRTPEHLTKQFEIPAGAGRGRAVPTFLFDYQGRNKRQVLATSISMTVAGALPEFAGKRRAAREVNQQTLADMCSVRRETFTRRLTQIATPDESWDDDRRQVRSRQEQQRALEQGKRIRQGNPRPRRSPVVLVHRKRRFGAGNVYNYAVPQKTKADRPECFYPELDQLRANPVLGPLFAANPILGRQQFKNVPGWIWDARLPLGDTARLVFTYYVFCGLLDAGENGKIRGEVHPKQATVAAACGISIKSVYRANGELSRLGLIRVYHPKPTRGADGSYTRGPARILYLPVRMLSEEEARIERLRLQSSLRAIRDAATADRARTIHQELLALWTGKEHCLRAFWNEVRRQMIAARLERSIVDRLVPRPPE